MQIVITLNSNEELMEFLDQWKEKTDSKKQPSVAAPEPSPEPALTQAAEPEPAPVPVPAPAAQVSRQDVQRKAISLMDAGKQKQLQELLVKYGVPALPSVPEDKLAAFMADLEVL